MVLLNNKKIYNQKRLLKKKQRKKTRATSLERKMGKVNCRPVIGELDWLCGRLQGVLKLGSGTQHTNHRQTG